MRIKIIVLLMFLWGGAVFAGPGKVLAINGIYEIKNININGNVEFNDLKILSLMATGKAGIFKKKVYHPRILQEDIRNILNFYHSQGYMDAEVKDLKVEQQDKKVTIDIFIIEGEVYKVEDIVILGNTEFEDDTVLSKVIMKIGEDFSRKKLSSSVQNILDFYGSKGYLNAEVETDLKLDKEDKNIIVNLRISEGNQHVVKEIEIRGLKYAKKGVVRRELEFKANDILTRKKIAQSQRNLYMTGLFNSVFINSRIDQKDRVKAVVEVEEKKTIELGAGIGYDTLEHFWQQAEIKDINIFGWGRKIGLSARRSQITRKGEMSFTEPGTFGTKWRTDLNIFSEYKDEPSYDITRTGGMLSVGRKLDKFTDISTRYRYERAYYENIEVSGYRKKDTVSEISAFIIKDTRNNLVSPSKGSYGEFSAGINTTENVYLKFQQKVRYFFTVKNLVIGSAVDIGEIIKIKGDVSANERFYGGGPNSIRGFGYREIGPVDESGEAAGGLLKFVFNVFEIRIPFYKIINIAVFGDMGNVWSEIREITDKGFRYAAGGGLRANTPIGVLRGDIGFNVFPEKDEEKYKIYFGAGLPF